MRAPLCAGPEYTDDFSNAMLEELDNEVVAWVIVPPEANVIDGLNIAEYWVQLLKNGIINRVKKNFLVII